VTPVPRQLRARQEGDGPAGCEGPRAEHLAEGSDIGARIIDLKALATADLQFEWQRLYRVSPPTRLSRDLLIRGVAYRLQEQAYGGLTLGTRRVLRSFADGSDEQGRSRAPPTILKPGTKLVREWHERVHTVSVLEDGFEYQGERYRSLTQIARQITGVHWSGPLFFGISKRRRAVEAAG
jgi:hypothetical protein